VNESPGGGNPRRDAEHQLDLGFGDGRIVTANGEPFVLDAEVHRPA
jgi:hypothetical protein